MCPHRFNRLFKDECRYTGFPRIHRAWTSLKAQSGEHTHLPVEAVVIFVLLNAGFVSTLEYKVSETNRCCAHLPSQDLGVVFGKDAATANSAENGGPNPAVGEAEIMIVLVFVGCPS